MQNKTRSTIIPAHEGTGIWQPGKTKGNCITIKASPWNIADATQTVFLHELPQGGQVQEHAHNKETEVFICLEGEGIMIIDEKEFTLKKHDVAYIAPLTKHSIRAISETPLKFMVIVSECGLEERLKLMGKLQKSINEAPPEPFESTLSKQNTHGVIR
jgi:mannose-6-phosphate isomerase-like protein (cupin superfamily)